MLQISPQINRKLDSLRKWPIVGTQGGACVRSVVAFCFSPRAEPAARPRVGGQGKTKLYLSKFTNIFFRRLFI